MYVACDITAADPLTAIKRANREKERKKKWERDREIEKERDKKREREEMERERKKEIGRNPEKIEKKSKRKTRRKEREKNHIMCMQINVGGPGAAVEGVFGVRVLYTRETVAIIMIYGTLSSSGCTDAPKHRSLRANNGLGLFS